MSTAASRLRRQQSVEADVHEQSLGSLLNRMNRDLAMLVRQEIELAKVEITEEVKRTGKSAGMLGGTAFAGYLAIVLLSFAAAFGIAVAIPLGWAFLAMGVFYLIVAAGLFVRGRQEIKTIRGPEQTVETLKEDVTWAREQIR